jgi:glycerol-3-phosphate cytidylyltransferase
MERYCQLVSLRYVDEVIPYDTEQDLINLLATVKIHKRFLGSDYNYSKITGEAVCHDRGIELVFIPRLHSWSSTELRERLEKCVQQ